jgi:hypothetical protein
MSMQEMTAVITQFQATTDALGALGARLGIGEGDTVAPEILAALDDVLAASGVAGGSVLDSDGAAERLRGAGCTDVHSLARKSPVPIGFVTGQKG